MLPHFVWPAIGYAAKKAGDYLNSRNPREFREHFAKIAKVGGVTFYLDDEDEFGSMSVPYSGETYTVVAGRVGDLVTIFVHSNVRFPHGRLPGDVCRDLVARNRKLPRFDWDSKDGKEAYFFVKGKLAYRSFCAETFLKGIKEMISEVAVFDRVLTEQGYVR